MFHWFLQLENTFKNPSTPLPSGNLAIINPHLEYVYLVNYLRFLGDSMASHMGVDKPRYRLFGWSCIYIVNTKWGTSDRNCTTVF